MAELCALPTRGARGAGASAVAVAELATTSATWVERGEHQLSDGLWAASSVTSRAPSRGDWQGPHFGYLRTRHSSFMRKRQKTLPRRPRYCAAKSNAGSRSRRARLGRYVSAVAIVVARNWWSLAPSGASR